MFILFPFFLFFFCLFFSFFSFFSHLVSLICLTLTILGSGVARTFGAHGQRTLRGPSPYFITLFLWSLPSYTPTHFAHVYLYYMILNTALFNKYVSHGVYWKFGSLWWRDMGNGGPWWRNDKWDPLITWWEIRGHNGGPLIDDAMMNWDPLDSVMGN